MTAKAVEPATEPETTEVEETPKVEPATPEVDAPVQKPRLLDCKLHVPWIDLRIPYWCIWLAALLLGVLLGWSFSDGWGATQWGPLAAWFGGILTAIAVSVSLWQASTAKQKSIKDEVDAANRLIDERQRQQDETAATEKRHQAELERADNRLIAQFDEQRRMEQIGAVKSLCNSMNAIFNSTWSEMSRSHAYADSEKTPQLIEQSRIERQSWVRTINNSSQDAALSLIGLYDQQLISAADQALHSVETLRREITGPSDEKIDWDAVLSILESITGHQKVIRSLATVKLQPAYHSYIITKANRQAEAGDSQANSQDK